MILVDGERIRAEDVYDPPLGTVLTDATGIRQVFVGWRANTVGREMVFCRAYTGEGAGQRVWHQWEPYIYHAAMADTLLRKFPGLGDHEKGV
jgi:hypothetical protein